MNPEKCCILTEYTFINADKPDFSPFSDTRISDIASVPRIVIITVTTIFSAKLFCILMQMVYMVGAVGSDAASQVEQLDLGQFDSMR